MEKTVLKKPSLPLETALSYLPGGLRAYIEDFIESLRSPRESVNEIRLRCPGGSSLVLGGKNILFDRALDREEMRDVFKRICGGAVFAHREDVCRGFVALDGGIRVGVCGFAKYDGGQIVGVGDISALVFRIPTGRCSFAKELFKVWKTTGGGMLICSGAGEGKTTAIRSLAGLIGSGDDARRVVVADERCEFLPSDYERMHVDILRGYKRALGVDIAIRTMSAEVIIVDEISSYEDARAMLASLGAGSSVIATVHARSLDDAMRRAYVKELIEGGLFESACIIKRRSGAFSFSLEKIQKTHG
jgi:stage III sporulation protein AA